MCEAVGCGWVPAFAGMTRKRSIQLAQELGEIAVARLRRRGLEGAAKRGGDAGMGWRNVDSDDPPVHGEIRRRPMFSF